MGVQKRPFLSAGWRVSPGAAYYCLRSLCRGKGPATQGKSMAAKVSPRVWSAESSANTCWYIAPVREWLLIRAFCRQALASRAAEMGSMLGDLGPVLGSLGPLWVAEPPQPHCFRIRIGKGEEED